MLNSKRSIEIYWMLIMTTIALIISATFLEGWISIYVLVVAGIIHILSQIFFWWCRWKYHQKIQEKGDIA